MYTEKTLNKYTNFIKTLNNQKILEEKNINRLKNALNNGLSFDIVADLTTYKISDTQTKKRIKLFN